MPPPSLKRKHLLAKAHRATQRAKAKRALLAPSCLQPAIPNNPPENQLSEENINRNESALPEGGPESLPEVPSLPSNLGIPDQHDPDMNEALADPMENEPTDDVAMDEEPVDPPKSACNRPPTGAEARAARDQIDATTRTPRRSGGYIYADLDPVTRRRFEGMEQCLNHFIADGSKGFLASSLLAARGRRQGATYARTLREWIRKLIDQGDLPYYEHGWWNTSILEQEDVALAIKEYLQKIGKYARAKDVVEFLAIPENRVELGVPKCISLRTAQRWMQRCGGFRWRSEPKGQYFDGHEREDVVDYRQSTFIPFWKEMERLRTIYNEDGVPDPTRPMNIQPGEKPILIWFHDESIFFANDRRLVRWVHSDEHAKPFKKGDGNTIMIADFVCAEFGWLQGKNGETARVVFRPGSSRDGYFTCEQVVKQLENAVKIVEASFPEYTHVFIYDNAPSHTKRPDDAISARHMPKKPTEVFLRPYTRKGKKFVPPRMEPGKLPDGRAQSFYYPNNHPQYPGYFKGMAQILRERGLDEIAEKRAECLDFKCEEGRTDCCCRRALFCQPDFETRDSTIEEAARKLGSRVVFLPKYHCELNPIEQCWGYAKKKYRDMPPSNKESVMKQYVLDSIDSVPLISIRRFAARSQRFVDAYAGNKSGSAAIEWATKIFRTHRQTPEHLEFHQI